MGVFLDAWECVLSLGQIDGMLKGLGKILGITRRRIVMRALESFIRVLESSVHSAASNSGVEL